MTDAVLRRLGIHPRQFRILLGLFQALSDRRELLNQQMGLNTGNLRMGAMINAVMGALLGILFLILKPVATAYLASCLFLTAFLLAAVLMAETAHTLVNPEEGMVLVHQPIGGATYTAAKLTHLGRVVVYMAGSFNAAPALFGVWTKGASFFYPLLHLAAALALGFCLALACCAFFGWMMRFIPPARMKAASQLAMVLPYLVLMPQFSVLPFLIKLWGRLPGGPWWGAAAILAGVAAVAFGLRALSADYLIQVTRFVQGGSRKRVVGVRNRGFGAMPGKLVSRLVGGPPARAGFAYCLRMMARDWQFRRQFVSFLPTLLMVLAGARSFRNPFGDGFSTAHIIPHGLGAFGFLVCLMLKPGAYPKAVWLFQLSPASLFSRFAGGISAAMWGLFVLAPHVLLLAAALWLWPVQDALLFCGYSLGVASLYLGLSLRTVDGLPFCHEAQASSTFWVLPVMAVGGAAAAAVVAVQHYILFRSEIAVIVVSLVVVAFAVDVTRRSIAQLAGSMRFFLSTLSEEKTKLYQEIA